MGSDARSLLLPTKTALDMGALPVERAIIFSVNRKPGKKWGF